MSEEITPTGYDDEPASESNVDQETATVVWGDETWHDGPGWYYVIDEYPDEGSVGAFGTREAAIRHAVAAWSPGYVAS